MSDDGTAACDADWYQEVLADAVARYDATPEHLRPIVVVHPEWLAKHEGAR
jgi:hypothetical protein